jgi:hypothetical protein
MTKISPLRHRRSDRPEANRATLHPHELYADIDYRVFWSGWQQCKLDQAEHAVVRDMLPAAWRRLIDIGCGFGRLAGCDLDRLWRKLGKQGGRVYLPVLRTKLPNYGWGT